MAEARRKRSDGTDVAEEIRAFNTGRQPDTLARKYKLMADNPFSFFRGTAHLFWSQWPRGTPPDEAPAVWLCGDLHFENFGSFRGDNRLAYFDLNDFDEAGLAPCLRDPVRLATSLFVARKEIGIDVSESRQMATTLVDAYAGALNRGKAFWVERETAEGAVRELLAGLRERKRKKLLNARTRIRHGVRKFVPDDVRLLHAKPEDHRSVRKVIDEFGKRRENPEFFKVLDVCRRVAGTGSLGVRRWAILVEGEGSPDRNALLDLKEAMPSAMAPSVAQPQPKLGTEAERVVTIQHWCQAASPALLTAVRLGPSPFILRELQPIEDRLSLEHVAKRRSRLERAVRTMGALIAWAQLRASARHGAAGPDELADFGALKGWRRALVDYARDYSEKVEHDWEEYREAYRAGYFDASKKAA